MKKYHEKTITLPSCLFVWDHSTVQLQGLSADDVISLLALHITLLGPDHGHIIKFFGPYHLSFSLTLPIFQHYTYTQRRKRRSFLSPRIMLKTRRQLTEKNPSLILFVPFENSQMKTQEPQEESMQRNDATSRILFTIILQNIAL